MNYQNLTIIFCLPGRTFSNNFLNSWSNLLVWLIKNNIKPIICNRYNSNVYYVRNSCLGGDVRNGIYQKPFNGKIKYDYLMWIDSDIVFTINDFINLLSHQKNIVSGLYLMKGGDNFATVLNWDKKFYQKNGYFEFLNIQKRKQFINNKQNLIKASYTGFGFILVKYGVFESLEYPWFRPIWENFNENMKDFTSEDVGICNILTKKGYKIFIDLNVVVGHEKSTILNTNSYI